MSTDATPWGAARSLAIIRHLRRLKAIERHTCRRPAQPATLLKDRIPKEPPKIDRASRPTVWRLACTRARIPLTRAVTADLSRAGSVLYHRTRVKKLEARSGRRDIQRNEAADTIDWHDESESSPGHCLFTKETFVMRVQTLWKRVTTNLSDPDMRRKSSRWREARPSGSSFC
jgi:hypothetical protein